MHAVYAIYAIYIRGYGLGWTGRTGPYRPDRPDRPAGGGKNFGRASGRRMGIFRFKNDKKKFFF